MMFTLNLRPISKEYYFALVRLQSKPARTNEIIQVTAELAVTKTVNNYFMVTQQCLDSGTCSK